MNDIAPASLDAAGWADDPIKLLQHKRLLVTGAAGFIGGALMRRLAQAGCQVTGTVLNPDEAEALRAQGFQAEVLDLASDEPFDAVVADTDIVFHIAAMFQETEHGEAMYEKVNATGALRLFEAAARMGAERFVHCSTVGVHGDVKETPCRETSPYNPMDLYHRTKLRGEQALLDCARKLPDRDMVMTINRPAMVYGPGDMRMLKLFRAILQRRFYMIGSGQVLAHLGYIDDQVESFLLSATAPRERVHLEAFNIASGEPITLNELARTVAEAGGVRLPRLHIPVFPVWLAGLACEMAWKPFGRRPPLFRRRVGFFTHNRAFDLSKARDRLGYTSRWDHHRGISATIAWYREQGLV